jgi:hypothetical protein
MTKAVVQQLIEMLIEKELEHREDLDESETQLKMQIEEMADYISDLERYTKKLEGVVIEKCGKIETTGKPSVRDLGRLPKRIIAYE